MDEEKITEQKNENPMNPQNEYNYTLAQQITKRLLVKGLITEAEFNKITAKNRESLSPLLARIMPNLTSRRLTRMTNLPVMPTEVRGISI